MKFCPEGIYFKILSTEHNHRMFVNLGLKKHLPKKLWSTSCFLLQGIYTVVDVIACVRQMFTAWSST